MSKSFEDILNKKANEFSLEPKLDMWDSIEPSLKKKSNKKRVLFFLLFGVGILSILLAEILFHAPKVKLARVVNNNTIEQKSTEFQRAENTPKNKPLNSTSKLNIETQSINIGKMQVISNNHNLFESRITKILQTNKIEILPEINIEKDNKPPLIKSEDLTEVKTIDTIPKITDIVIKDTAKKDSIIRLAKPFKYPKFFVGAHLNMLQSNTWIKSKNDLESKAKKTDKPISTIGFGICIGKNKLMSEYSIGLNYLQFGYKRQYITIEEFSNTITPIVLGNQTVFDTSQSLISNSISTNNRVVYKHKTETNTYQYLSMPFGYTQYLLNRKVFNFGIAVQVAPSIAIEKKGLVFNHATQSYNNYDKIKSKISVGCLFQVGLPFRFSVYKNWGVSFTPFYGISSHYVNKQPIYARHQYWGVQCGINYKFF